MSSLRHLGLFIGVNSAAQVSASTSACDCASEFGKLGYETYVFSNKAGLGSFLATTAKISSFVEGLLNQQLELDVLVVYLMTQVRVTELNVLEIALLEIDQFSGGMLGTEWRSFDSLRQELYAIPCCNFVFLLDVAPTVPPGEDETDQTLQLEAQSTVKSYLENVLLHCPLNGGNTCILSAIFVDYEVNDVHSGLFTIFLLHGLTTGLAFRANRLSTKSVFHHVDYWCKQLQYKFQTENQVNTVSLYGDIEVATLSAPIQVPFNFGEPGDKRPPAAALPPLYFNLDIADLRNKVTRATESFAIVAVVPTLGMGTSITAKALCWNLDTRVHYSGGIYWLALGEHTTSHAICAAQATLLRVLAQFQGGFSTTEEGNKKLNAVLAARAKPCLIVLDDVWKETDVQAFKLDKGSSSCLVVVSSSHTLAENIGAHQYLVHPLDARNALDFLSLHAGEELTPTTHTSATQIAAYCQYLPMPMRLLGMLVRKGISWSAIAQDIRTALSTTTKQTTNHLLHAALVVIYKYLPAELLPYFQNLAVFSTSIPLKFQTLATLWSTLGTAIDDVEAERICEAFEEYGLLWVNQAECTVQLHEFYSDHLKRTVHSRDMKLLHKQFVDGYARLAPQWYDIPNDGYVFHWIAMHWKEALMATVIEEMYTNFHWLQAKLDVTNIGSLLQDFALNLSSSSSRHYLAKIRDTLSQCKDVLYLNPMQLKSQLVARLLQSSDTAAQYLLQEILRGSRPYNPVTSVLWLRPRFRPPVASPAGGSETPLIFTFACPDRVETVIAGAGGRLLACVGAPDALLVTAQTLQLFDVPTGEEMLRYHVRALTCVAACDGGRYAYSSSRKLRVWTPASGDTAALEGDAGNVRCIVSRGDDMLVTGDEYGVVKFWDLRGMREVGEFPAHSAPIRAMLTPSTLTLVTASADALVKVWDLTYGLERCVFAEHKGSVDALLLLPAVDGAAQQVISAGADGHVRWWELETAAAVRSVAAGSAVTALVIIGEELYCATGMLIKVYDAATGESIRAIKAHTSLVTTLGHDGEGRLVSGSWDHNVKLWSTTAIRSQGVNVGHRLWVQALVITRSGVLLSGSGDGTIKLWDARTGKELSTVEAHARPINALLLDAAGGQLVSGGSDKMVKLWAVDEAEATLRELRQMYNPGYMEMVQCLCWASVADDEQLLAIGFGSGDIKLWDPTADKVNALASTVRRRLLSGGSDNTVRLWDIATGAQAAVFDDCIAFALALVPGNRFVCTDADYALLVRDLVTGEVITRLKGHTQEVTYIERTPDNKLISSSKDGTIRVWRLDEAEEEMWGSAGQRSRSCWLERNSSLLLEGSDRLLCEFTGDVPINCGVLQDIAMADGGGRSERHRVLVCGDQTGHVFAFTIEAFALTDLDTSALTELSEDMGAREDSAQTGSRPGSAIRRRITPLPPLVTAPAEAPPQPESPAPSLTPSLPPLRLR